MNHISHSQPSLTIKHSHPPTRSNIMSHTTIITMLTNSWLTIMDIFRSSIINPHDQIWFNSMKAIINHQSSLIINHPWPSFNRIVDHHLTMNTSTASHSHHCCSCSSQPAAPLPLAHRDVSLQLTDRVLTPVGQRHRGEKWLGLVGHDG